MTRVLFWNIEKFSINKFYSASRKRPRGQGGLTNTQATTQKRRLLGDVLTATRPDIVVIIEVSSGDNFPDALATQSAGVNGLVYLQGLLNSAANLLVAPGGWNIVPPLYTGTGGRSETVGILYRRQNDAGTLRRYFTGPNIWTGGYAGTSAVPGTAVAAAYPSVGGVNFNAMLVPAGLGVVRQIPAGALDNGTLNENEVAARIAFNRINNAGNGVGGPVNFNGLREPFMATFCEADVNGNVQRNLSIFGIHSPPQANAAPAYMNQLATIWDIVRPLRNNETRIVGGDFNLNLLNANGSASGAYAPLTGGGNQYTPLLDSALANAAQNVAQYRGYFSTHIRGKVSSASSNFLWSENQNNQAYYPGYGYVGSNFTQAPFYAIDNILVWPHQGANNYQTTILNMVTGTPFNLVNAPADNPPQGSNAIVMASRFGAPPLAGWPQAPTAANYPGVGAAKRLTGWDNYGRIRKTSDHFAVFADA
ncbi:endonuclease/exonuclease/phosphatase family protein [Labrenzia sp. OB1]|uniref:endonuclease/exonuclease/phosphatase family protein n=1 Tax=Labrenzia sp. OB1 TaxID=1561204 RepID=UPI0007B2E578|nr:endonuclease/exonuclease/phosphatase family protein [Labrenzia sp. OB1]KZM50911.1 hypothetical protein OA90_07915 [Labrenzia sp. OB1]